MKVKQLAEGSREWTHQTLMLDEGKTIVSSTQHLHPASTTVVVSMGWPGAGNGLGNQAQQIGRNTVSYWTCFLVLLPSIPATVTGKCTSNPSHDMSMYFSDFSVRYPHNVFTFTVELPWDTSRLDHHSPSTDLPAWSSHHLYSELHKVRVAEGKQFNPCGIPAANSEGQLGEDSLSGDKHRAGFTSRIVLYIGST